MKYIELVNGEQTTVDDDDFEELSKYKWMVNNEGYVMRNAPRNGGKKRNIWMHRIIMKTPNDMITEHRDGNKLNNQKQNLRVCTYSENSINRRKSRVSTSGYKGVYKSRNRWRARVGVTRDGKYKLVHAGTFDTPREAAEAYNNAALKYDAKFARPNEL